MGTVPVSLVHKSAGKFDSDSWRAAAASYFAKWNE
jgi:hypothetical protein